MKFYIRQILIALDQLINAFHGGWADETISSRAWRLRANRPYRYYVRVIDAIFFRQKNHCQRSYENERKRSQLPVELR